MQQDDIDIARRAEKVLRQFLRYCSPEETETYESWDPTFTRYVTVEHCNWWLEIKRCGITVERMRYMLERDPYYRLYYRGWEVAWISIKIKVLHKRNGRRA